MAMARSGAIFRCEAEFAGIKGTACQYKRSDGFAPEPGWIDLNVRDLKRIRIVPRGLPWRAVNGVEFDGGISIRTWKNFQARATVTGDRPPIPQPAGGGLPQFGDLVLRTQKGLAGDLYDEIRYKDVYVDSTGLEEVTRGLADIESHSSGIVRVPLTDIRRLYRRAGMFYGRINCRLKSGKLDPQNLNGESPWTFEEVVEYLFSQLPGSPAVHKDSDFRGRSYDAPVIEGQGEPAVEHLERLLDLAGLKPQMLPDGNYTVSRRYSTVLSRGDIPSDVGSARHVDELHYERASASMTDRPAAVWGVGPRIVRRGSFPCVAVLRDTDGRFYRLTTICRRWGYSIGSLRQQVFASSQFRYSDVNPQPGSDASDALHFKRQEILKEAYHLYAPAYLLPENEDDPIIDPATEAVRYFPPVKAAYYRNELGDLSKIPSDEGGKGDLDEYVLLDPIIRGQTVAQRFMRNFDEFQRVYDSRSASDQAVLANLEQLNTTWERALTSVVQDFLAAEKAALSTLDPGKLAQFGVTTDAGGLVIGGDRSVARELGELMPASERDRAVRELLSDWGYDEVSQRMAREAGDMIGGYRAKMAEWEKKFSEFKETYQERIAIPCRYNTPQQVLPPGLAAMDPRTGIIRSAVPLAAVDKPFFFSGDAQRVVADGAVVVTHGYELQGSEMECWTNFLFAAEAGDPTSEAKVIFCGSSRSSPLKAETVRIGSRMYQMDNGNPVNYNECWAEAKSKASAALRQPAVVEGYAYELIGLRKAVLYAGVNSVQHDWDGEVAMTHVMVNAPGARGPLGPADLGSGRGPGRRPPGMTRAEGLENHPAEAAP